MTKKKLLLLVLILGTLSLIAQSLYDQKMRSEAETNRLKGQNSLEGNEGASSTDDLETATKNLDALNKSPNQNSDSNFQITPPTTDDLRGEISKDPHSTPPSLIKFSHQIGEKVRNAKGSAQKISLFIELESCALKDNAENVQAICLLNARKLSLTEKKLANPYQTLSQKVSPEALKRIEKIP